MLNQALSLKSNRKLFSAFSLKSHHTQPAPPPKNPNSAVKDVDPKSWWCDQTLWLRVTTDSSLACLRRGLASRVFAGGLAVLSSFFFCFSVFRPPCISVIRSCCSSTVFRFVLNRSGFHFSVFWFRSTVLIFLIILNE
jgi:hypothetical protein